MIKNYGLPPFDRERILRQLQESEWEFYLTGSRFFKNNGEESDWDFFAELSDAKIDFLKSLGFKLGLPGSRYDHYIDQEIVMVMRHSCGIDVQLVQNANVKNAAQDLIWIMNLSSSICKTDKALRNRTWKRAYQYVRASMGLPQR